MSFGQSVQMLKLVLNVEYLLSLSFLTTSEFYNLGHIQDIIRILKIVFGVLGDLAIPLAVLEFGQDMLKFQLNLVVFHVLEKVPNYVTRNRVRKSPKILQLIVNGVHGVTVMLNVVRAIKSDTLNNLPFLAAKNVREETVNTVSKNHVL